MGEVVFKVKFNSPNHYKKSPMLNKNHLLYIATRPRSIHNIGKSYSLFGRVSDLGFDEFGNIDNLNRVSNHIEDMSKKRLTVYKAVISLDETDAIELGYGSRKKWEELVKKNINNIAYNHGIKSMDIEYVASFHMEKGHPHIHLMYWDRNQKEYRGRIDKKNLNNIRRDLNKYVFEDEIKNLYILKDEYKNKFREEGENALDDLIEVFNSYEKEKNKFFKLPTLNIKEENKLNDLFIDLIESINLKAKKGRLNYAFMPKEIKEKLDNFSVELMSGNTELSSNFESYIKIGDALKKYGIYTGDGREELYKNLGNATLNVIKEIKKNNMKKSTENDNTKKNIQYMKSYSETVADLIVSFNMILADENNTNEKMLNDVRELSKQAKKEYAIKMEHASEIDWQRS